MNKNKIRSNYEIKLRKKAFLEVTDLFKAKNINFFLYGGALLGFRREKNFIKWDWDVEIGMHEKNLRKDFLKILKNLRKNNFKIIKHDIDELKIIFTKYSRPNVTQFEINGLVYDFFSKSYIRKKLNIPSHFFNKMSHIKIFKRNFASPGPINEFLNFFYGNWKDPLNTTDKNKYLNKKLRKENFWKIYVKINKIKKKINNILF